MKYIKKYEEIDNSKLIPNNMYLYRDIPALYLGYDVDFVNFPLAIITFPYKNEWFGSTQWISDIDITPLNITIKDYLIKNPHLINDFLDELEYPNYLGKLGKEKAAILRRQLLEDKDIKMILNANKYNL